MKRSRSNFSQPYVRLLVTLLLLTTIPATARGEDPSLVPASQTWPKPAAQAELEGPEEAPAAEPRRRRRLLERLGPPTVTTEQREEAERLRKLAAKYGTDPTAIVGRAQLSSAYTDLPQRTHIVDAIARVDLPFRGNYLLSVNVPFLKWSNPDRPGATSQSGFSDLAVTAGWRAYNTPEYAVLLGVVSTMPTAAETGLGLGKYTVGPTIATAKFMPRWDSFLIGGFTQQMSVGGDPSRKPLNLSKALAQINSFWGERWWTVAQSVWQVDWERSGKASMILELEVGRSVVGRWGAYARPGIGVFGRELLGAYDWNIEFGIRRMFKSF